MRDAMLLEYKRVEREGRKFYEKVETGCLVKFHQFGINYEEFDTGPGNYSTAIVELPDGEIRNVEVELVKFVVTAE